MTGISYHNDKCSDTDTLNKLRCKLAVLQNKHVIIHKENPSNALLHLNINADYLNYQPWSLLSENSRLTTASEISHFRHFKHPISGCVDRSVFKKPPSLLWWTFLRNTLWYVRFPGQLTGRMWTESHLVWQGRHPHWPVTPRRQQRTNQSSSILEASLWYQWEKYSRSHKSTESAFKFCTGSFVLQCISVEMLHSLLVTV